ncbi:MAG: hypothetical protein WB564_09260 [Dehalococcoidia bacterium]
MTVRVQIELSDEEDRIIEGYRIEHNKKSNEEAIKEIIKHYKIPNESKEKKKTSWWKRF